MTSLSEKRYIARLNKSKHEDRDTVNMENVNLNTDELETKLDTIIENTNHDTLVNGEYNFTLIGSAEGETPVIDIGNQSGQYLFQWAGTESTTNLEYTIWTSTDNITFYPLPNALAVKTNGYISMQYEMMFQYHKLKILNTHASQSASVTVVYSGRH